MRSIVGLATLAAAVLAEAQMDILVQRGRLPRRREPINWAVSRVDLTEREIVSHVENLHCDDTVIPDSPLTFNTPAKDIALVNCGLDSSCMSSYHKSGHIDFRAVEEIIRAELIRSGLKVAFSGYAAGELLVNSEAISTNPRSYYQIRVIAESYIEKNKISLFGAVRIDASKITLLPNTTTADGDAMSARIEESIIASIHFD